MKLTLPQMAQMLMLVPVMSREPYDDDELQPKPGLEGSMSGAGRGTYGGGYGYTPYSATVNRPQWNPETHPYRVSVTRRGSAANYGWRRDQQTFQSLEEAQAAAAEARKTPNRGINMDFFSNGKWTKINP